MAGPWQTDETLGLNHKKEYILKHYPKAHAEFMSEAARWVIYSRGKYNENITIGTGGTERAAWQSAYKFTKENVSPMSHPVVTEKPAETKGALEFPAVYDANLGLWKPLTTEGMPVGWHPERQYTQGEVVYMKDGSVKVYGGGKLHELIQHKTVFGEYIAMNPITNETFTDAHLKQGAKTVQGIEALKEQAASGALDKLKQGIDKKYDLHVGQYIPVSDPDDVKVLTKAQIKPIPINASPEWKNKKIGVLKPMLLPKKQEQSEEDFEPVVVKSKPFSSINVKADLKDQTLVQHIGVASNCNVIIQQAFSSKGAFGRKIRLVCKQCGKDKVYLDEVVFHMTSEGIVNELKEFCFSHRHDGGKVEMPWKTVAVPDPTLRDNYRRFRED